MSGFYQIWAWRPSWSCDLDFAINFEMPLPKEAPHKISTRSAKRFQRRRSLKLWTTDGRTDGRRRDGRTPDHGHPISSPCEPSGELKIANFHFSRFKSIETLSCNNNQISYSTEINQRPIAHPVNSVYTQSVTIRQPVMVLLRACIGGLAKCLGDVARCIGYGVRDLVLSCFVRKI